MSRVAYTVETATYDATDRTNVELTTPGDRQRYDKHILTIVCTGTPSAGTITIRRKALNGTRWIALTDAFGVATTISLATNDCVEIDGAIEGLQLDIASLGTATAWKAVLSGIAD